MAAHKVTNGTVPNAGERPKRNSLVVHDVYRGGKFDFGAAV
jgi:hypothetical protein